MNGWHRRDYVYLGLMFAVFLAALIRVAWQGFAP